MKFLGQEFQKLEHEQYRQTDRQTQTNAIERITTDTLAVVGLTNLFSISALRLLIARQQGLEISKNVLGPGETSCGPGLTCSDRARLAGQTARSRETVHRYRDVPRTLHDPGQFVLCVDIKLILNLHR